MLCPKVGRKGLRSMSYDVTAKCPCGCVNCDHRYVDWNYTSNMARAWREAGTDIEEFDGQTCGELADSLDAAIRIMEDNEEDYAEMFNSRNGWGSMATLIPALKNLRDQCNECRVAIVRVRR